MGRARIALGRVGRELVGDAARDLEVGPVARDADGADLAARDAAAPADQRQDPVGLGAILGAEVDLERHHLAVGGAAPARRRRLAVRRGGPRVGMRGGRRAQLDAGQFLARRPPRQRALDEQRHHGDGVVIGDELLGHR
ncbi:MAG TPA: hypothetical protein VF997_05455, partial [Polyangia bacterium]